MKKVVTLTIIAVLASLAAGIYGIIHDQITYTISPEYYTHYKFIQFGLTDNASAYLEDPRLCASIVGFLATWWIGLLLGLFIGGLVLLFSNMSNRKLLMLCLNNTGVISTCVIAGGFIGYFWGVVLTETTGEAYNMHEIILNPEKAKRFTIVSFTHSFGYIGSVVGFALAVYRTFKKLKKIA